MNFIVRSITSIVSGSNYFALSYGTNTFFICLPLDFVPKELELESNRRGLGVVISALPASRQQQACFPFDEGTNERTGFCHIWRYVNKN